MSNALIPDRNSTLPGSPKILWWAWRIYLSVSLLLEDIFSFTENVHGKFKTRITRGWVGWSLTRANWLQIVPELALKITHARDSYSYVLILTHSVSQMGTQTCQQVDRYSVELNNNILVYWGYRLLKIVGILSGEMQKLLSSAGQPLAKNQEGVGCIAGVPAGKMKV